MLASKGHSWLDNLRQSHYCSSFERQIRAFGTMPVICDGDYVSRLWWYGTVYSQLLKSQLCCCVWQWLRWHHSSNVLLAGTGSGDVWMWLVPTSSCKTFAGHGARCTVGEILHNGELHCFILAAINCCLLYYWRVFCHSKCNFLLAR